MSSAQPTAPRFGVRDLLSAVRARGRDSAVWPLTAAFALPLFLGVAVLLGGAYALILRADVEAAQAATLDDAADLQGAIEHSLAFASLEHAAAAVVDQRVYAQNPEPEEKVDIVATPGGSASAAAPQAPHKSAGARPPITSFYRMDRMALAGGVLRLAERRGDTEARLTPLTCPWWSPPDLAQCFGAAPRAGEPHWLKIATDKNPDWGIAVRVQISQVGFGRGVGPAPGVRKPPINIYVGRKYALPQVRAGILGLAGWTLGAAGLAALGIGLLVSLSMLRRVEAVNQVCDRVMQGDLAARAGGEAARDEFGDLSRHVNTMLEQIAALVLGLRDVSNRIAHDLRTPIARLKGRLEDVAEAGDVAAARAGAEAAAAETDEILATFQALLDIAEVEAGAGGGLQPMRLDEAARSAIDLYDAVAEEAGVTLAPALAETRLLGEPTLVVRLIANLVDNAIKFSPRGGAVRVTVERRDGEALVRVADQGPGIPAEDRQGVMRRFIRGSSSGAAPGHGLGLALVAAVAKRHGAKIRMDDAAPGLVIEVTFKAF